MSILVFGKTDQIAWDASSQPVAISADSIMVVTSPNRILASSFHAEI